MKKGFTLVELLAVIIILGIILMISIPIISNVIIKARLKVYKANEEILLKAAETYYSKNHQLLPKELGDTHLESINIFINTGYMEEINDPKDEEQLCDGYIRIKKIDNYNYKYKPYIGCIEYQTEGYNQYVFDIPMEKLILHLDSSQLDYNSNDKISRWIDLSGEGNDAVQESESKQPIYQDSTAYFDGASTVLLVPNINGHLNPNKEMTWVVLYRVGGDHSQYDTIMGFGSNNWDIRMDGPNYFRSHTYNKESDWASCTDLNRGTVAPSLLEGFNFIIYTWNADIGNKRVYINGIKTMELTMRTNTTAKDLSTFNFSVGAIHNGISRHFSGDIAEILYYKRALTEEEAQTISNYLTDKWNL